MLGGKRFGRRVRSCDYLRCIVAIPVAVAIMLGTTGTGLAQTSKLKTNIPALMEPVTEGRGPDEKVMRFKPAKDADKFRFSDASIAALSAAMEANDQAATRAAQLALGVQAFGDTQGVFAAMGGVAEHALLAKSFSGVNNALNNVGFVFALAQVARDATNGDKEAAVFGALKSFVNFSIGRWGSSALQIAGIATFVVDVTLREWQSGLTEIGVNVWTCRYNAYYDDKGMSVSDWKVKALKLYEEAKKSDAARFEADLDKALDEYVQRAFAERNIAFFSECNGSYFGDTKTIQRLIEAEHKGVLEKLMVKHVLPEVSERAWQDNLKQQISNANYTLKPDLNQSFLLEVTVYDAPDGARVVMPLPNGGEWGGALRPDGTFRAKITHYALLKAGFPERVRLEAGDLSEEHALVIADGRMTTVFGVPKTREVVRYQLQEGSQSCKVRRFDRGKLISEEQQSRDARPSSTVDMAESGIGAVFLGHYHLEDETWSPASPGRHVSPRLVFGAPYVDDIQAMKNCHFDFFTIQNLVEGECSIERFERKAFGENKVIERTCASTAQMDVIGIFASLGGSKKQYFGMDTPEGREAVAVIRKIMNNSLTSDDPAGFLRDLQ